MFSMTQTHVAFILDPSYGHIVPTLGVAMELVQRGHRVSYAVSAGFAHAVTRAGGQARIIEPLDARSGMCELTRREDHSFDIGRHNLQLMSYITEVRAHRTANTLAQLERLYADDKPDVIIHDDVFDLAGRALATNWQIPKIRHYPAIIDPSDIPRFAEDGAVIVPVPGFFNENAAAFDERFKFIGFVAEGRREFLSAWHRSTSTADLILVSSSTGLLPQVEFYERMIRAFENQPWQVVLSIGSKLDPASEVAPDLLSRVPANFALNQHSSNFEILGHARLFVGQGGQGSTLEALYCGVPQLLVSPSPVHDMVARRVSALGLGVHLQLSNTFPDDLRRAAVALLEDRATLDRVREARALMHEDRAAQMAADVIEQCS